jgi:hypothetical protein
LGGDDIDAMNSLIISVVVMVVVILLTNIALLGFGAGCVAMYLLMK